MGTAFRFASLPVLLVSLATAWPVAASALSSVIWSMTPIPPCESAPGIGSVPDLTTPWCWAAKSPATAKPAANKAPPKAQVRLLNIRLPLPHRLSTIVNADLILVLDDGQIIERGRHDELMDSRGFYYNLYMSQFRKQEEAVQPAEPGLVAK